jgi:integrase
LADARGARDAARELVRRGIDPNESRRLQRLEAIEAQRARIAELASRRTVRDAFGRWQELYLDKHRKDGGAEIRAVFERHVLPLLGDRALDSLRRSDVTDLIDAIVVAGKSARTANRRTANMTLALLRQFVRWCAVREWIDRDPTLGITKKDAGGREEARSRNLSELEIVELRDRMQAANLTERTREALWLLLATGARVGELSGAAISEFDLETGRWSISADRTKNGDAHVVHLSAFARARVERLIALSKGSRWILPGRTPRGAPADVAKPISPKYIAKQVNDRQRAVPLKGRSKSTGTLMLSCGDWTPHDLRRTMASRMGDLGVRPDVIERCLNHRPEGIAAVYQRADLMPERLAAFDAWGAKLDALMRTETSNVTAIGARTAGRALADDRRRKLA